MRENKNQQSFLTAIEIVDCFVDLFIVRDWLSLVPPTAAVAGLGYVSYLAFCPEARKSIKVARVNKLIRMDDAKVADFVDIEDIADKAAFCRCWKSKNVCLTLTFYGMCHDHKTQHYAFQSPWNIECILRHLNICIQALGINRFNCLVNSVYITLTSNLSYTNIMHKHSKAIGNAMIVIFTEYSSN